MTRIYKYLDSNDRKLLISVGEVELWKKEM